MNKSQNYFQIFTLAIVIDIKRFILNTATNLLILGNRGLCNRFVTQLSVSIYNDCVRFEDVVSLQTK